MCQRVVSSTLPGHSQVLPDPVVTCPTSGVAILAVPNCKTHNPPLTSTLSSLLGIMTMWILIDQGDYYRSLNMLLFCPTCDWLNLESRKQAIMYPSFTLPLFFFSFFTSFLCDLRLPHNTYIRAYFTLRICDYNQES